MGITDGGADKAKTAFFQIEAQSIGFREVAG
jgi:hypothetical protein